MCLDIQLVKPAIAEDVSLVGRSASGSLILLTLSFAPNEVLNGQLNPLLLLLPSSGAADDEV